MRFGKSAREWGAVAICLTLAAAGSARAQSPTPSSHVGTAATGVVTGVAASESSATAEAAVAPPPTGEENVLEARRRYAQGAEFYRRLRYSEAVAEFTEAYTLWQNPTILFALGQAFEGLSDVNRAVESYERYLATSPEDDLRRPDVAAMIRELQGLLASVHVDSTVAAEVYVDGESRGEAPGDFRIATGRHEIELRAEGYESQSQTITVAGGTERTVAFTLRAVAATAQMVRVEREPFRFPRSVFYTAVGVTGAGLLTWASMATVTLVRADNYNTTPGSTNFDRDDARVVARRSNVVLAATGGVGAATAIIGVLTRWHRDDPDDEAATGTIVTAGVEPVVGGAIISARWSR